MHSAIFFLARMFVVWWIVDIMMVASQITDSQFAESQIAESN